ncbi:MAG: hypothetical protein IKE14_05685 [Loktanella sp.]|nr:hypothetical protein [Loktanella sp.]
MIKGIRINDLVELFVRDRIGNFRRRISDQLSMTPQQFRTHRMKGAHPLHALVNIDWILSNTLFHFCCRLVGKGDSQDLI